MNPHGTEAAGTAEPGPPEAAGPRHARTADRTAAVVHGDGGEIAPVHGIEAKAVDFQPGQRFVGHGAIDHAITGDMGKVPHPAHQAASDTRRAACAAGNLAWRKVCRWSADTDFVALCH